MAQAKKSTKKSSARRATATPKTITVAVEPTKAQLVGAKAAALGKHSTGYLGNFVNFVREQGVVGLAVGLAIGTAAGASVKVIVDQLIAPLVGLMTQGVDLNSLKWVLIAADPAHHKHEVAIGWGLIISSLITLLATAFVVYQVVHLAKLDRLDRAKS
jgi:large conductance mechanosensitive channel